MSYDLKTPWRTAPIDNEPTRVYVLDCDGRHVFGGKQYTPFAEAIVDAVNRGAERTTEAVDTRMTVNLADQINAIYDPLAELERTRDAWDSVPAKPEPKAWIEVSGSDDAFWSVHIMAPPYKKRVSNFVSRSCALADSSWWGERLNLEVRTPESTDE